MFDIYLVALLNLIIYQIADTSLFDDSLTLHADTLALHVDT